MRVSPLIPSTHDSLVAQKHFRSPPMVSTHDGLTYDRAISSALQATTACDAHGQVFVNNAKSAINNTSAKMTCVVVLSINALMTYMVAGLCGL